MTVETVFFALAGIASSCRRRFCRLSGASRRFKETAEPIWVALDDRPGHISPHEADPNKPGTGEPDPNQDASRFVAALVFHGPAGGGDRRGHRCRTGLSAVLARLAQRPPRLRCGRG